MRCSCTASPAMGPGRGAARWPHGSFRGNCAGQGRVQGQHLRPVLPLPGAAAGHQHGRICAPWTTGGKLPPAVEGTGARPAAPHLLLSRAEIPLGHGPRHREHLDLKGQQPCPGERHAQQGQVGGHPAVQLPGAAQHLLAIPTHAAAGTMQAGRQLWKTEGNKTG